MIDARRRAALVARCSLVVVALLAGGCPPDPVAPEAGVVGRTVDAEDGSLLPYAAIEPLGAGFTRRARADGSFAVDGLPSGTWTLRFSDDVDGDGWPERGAVRVARVARLGDVERERASFGAALGDVALGAARRVAGTLERADGGALSSRARVVAYRGREDLSAAERSLAALLPPDGVADHLGVEAVAELSADGSFAFAGLLPGTSRVVAWDRDESGAPWLSAPVVVDATADAVDVGPLVLAAASGTRAAVVELAFDPPLEDGDGYLVRALPLGEPRDGAPDLARHLGTVPLGTVARRIELQLPLGVVDIYLDNTPGSRAFHGLLPGQVVLPDDEGSPLRLGPVLVTPTDPCAAIAVDRDGDGAAALPALADAPELWEACASSCQGRGSAAAAERCTFAGKSWDCDDDADGQPDVEEPACRDICAGADRDGDGVCDRRDPVIGECALDCEPPGDAGAPSVDGGGADDGGDVVDAGAEPQDDDGGQPQLDAGEPPGDDAGPAAPRARCDEAVELPGDGLLAGDLTGRPDDVDGCGAPLARDAVIRVRPPGELLALVATTEGSPLDTVLSVLDASCDGAAPLACSDDAIGAAARVELYGLAADELFLVVEGAGGAVGEYVLEVAGVLAPGAACDPLAPAFSCGAGSCAPAGAGYACLAPRDCADGVDADDDGAVDEDAASCAAPPSVSCPSDVAVPRGQRVELSASAVDDGAVARVRWTLFEAPPAARAALSSTTAPLTSFVPPLLGRYRLRYAAIDDDGEMSACVVEVQATTSDALHVELVWDAPALVTDESDLDLHLLHPLAERWFDDELDCYWATCSTEALPWTALDGATVLDGGEDASEDAGEDAGQDAGEDAGEDAGQDAGAEAGPPADDDDDAGPAQPSAHRDPRLHREDTRGGGPEIIGIHAPALGANYRVGVHHWLDHGSGAADAELRVYCYGALRATLGPAALDGAATDPFANELWRAADVSFDDDGCTVTALDDDAGEPLVTTAEQARAPAGR